MSVKKYIIPITGDRALFLTVYDVLENLGMASNLKSDSAWWNVTFESPLLGEGQVVEFLIDTTYSPNIPKYTIKNSSDFSNISVVFSSHARYNSQSFDNRNMRMYVDDEKMWVAICAFDNASGASNLLYIGKAESGKKIIFSCGERNYTLSGNTKYWSFPNGIYDLENISSGELILVSEQRTIAINHKYAQKDFNITGASGEILKNGEELDTIIGIKNLCCNALKGLTECSDCDLYQNMNTNNSGVSKDGFYTAIKIDYDEVIDLTLPQED